MTYNGDRGGLEAYQLQKAKEYKCICKLPKFKCWLFHGPITINWVIFMASVVFLFIVFVNGISNWIVK